MLPCCNLHSHGDKNASLSSFFQTAVVVSPPPSICDIISLSPFPVPSQPTELKAEVKSETSVLLSWLPPAHSGTDAIIGYELVYRLGDQPEQVSCTRPAQ